jgi:hypothetical protein
MSQLAAFRKLIREEVRQVLREELKSFLTEVRKATPVSNNYVNTLKEGIKKEVPKQRPKTAPVVSSDPLQQLLAETAFGMDQSEYRTMLNAGSDMAQGFPQMFQQDSYEETRPPQVVESVTEMLANTRPATDINFVEIDTVPDFSNLMKALKDKGQI